MAKINLEKMSLKDLKQLSRDIDKAMTSAEKTQRAEALAAAEAAAKKHGFSLNDLTGSSKKTTKKAVAPAKYAHPENAAKTWSGRGRQPGWVKDALKAGKSLEDFLISA